MIKKLMMMMMMMMRINFYSYFWLGSGLGWIRLERFKGEQEEWRRKKKY